MVSAKERGRYREAIPHNCGAPGGAGVRLHQLVWALIISRNHLLHFLQRECFVDSILEVFGELEVQQMLDQFFDRAVYYSILGYDETLYDQPRGAGSQKRRPSISRSSKPIRGPG